MSLAVTATIPMVHVYVPNLQRPNLPVLRPGRNMGNLTIRWCVSPASEGRGRELDASESAGRRRRFIGHHAYLRPRRHPKMRLESDGLR